MASSFSAVVDRRYISSASLNQTSGALVRVALPTLWPAAQLARWMPANWRAHCPHEREVRTSNERDSEAAGVNTRRCYVSMNRAVGCEPHGRARRRRRLNPGGSASADTGIEAALNITASCVHTGKHSCVTTSRAADAFGRVSWRRSRRSRASASQVL